MFNSKVTYISISTIASINQTESNKSSHHLPSKVSLVLPNYPAELSRHYVFMTRCIEFLSGWALLNDTYMYSCHDLLWFVSVWIWTWWGILLYHSHCSDLWTLTTRAPTFLAPRPSVQGMVTMIFWRTVLNPASIFVCEFHDVPSGNSSP